MDASHHAALLHRLARHMSVPPNPAPAPSRQPPQHKTGRFPLSALRNELSSLYVLHAGGRVLLPRPSSVEQCAQTRRNRDNTRLYRTVFGMHHYLCRDVTADSAPSGAGTPGSHSDTTPQTRSQEQPQDYPHQLRQYPLRNVLLLCNGYCSNAASFETVKDGLYTVLLVFQCGSGGTVCL